MMSLGSKNQNFDYFIDDKKLSNVDEERDLGILTENTLSITRHCEEVAAGASRMAGLLDRTFRKMPAKTKSKLYKTFVRPKLEFAAPVWSPWLKKDIDIIEGVQRRCTRHILNLQHWDWAKNQRSGTYRDYGERLSILGLTTLVERRKRGQLITIYKVKNGLLDIGDTDRALFFTDPDPRGIDTRGHDRRIVMWRTKLNIARNFITYEGAKNWNALPANIVQSKCLNNFKSRLDRL